MKRILAMLSNNLDEKIKEAKSKSIMASLETQIYKEEENLITAQTKKLSVNFEDPAKGITALTTCFAEEKESQARLDYLKEVKEYLLENVDIKK